MGFFTIAATYSIHLGQQLVVAKNEKAECFVSVKKEEARKGHKVSLKMHKCNAIKHKSPNDPHFIIIEIS